MRIPDHFSTSLTTAEYGILGDLLAFRIQSPADFHDTRRMTDADKAMNTQHLGNDPADIRMRIRISINPGIRIRIPDQFWLRFCPWRRFAIFEHSLVVPVVLPCSSSRVFEEFLRYLDATLV